MLTDAEKREFRERLAKLDENMHELTEFCGSLARVLNLQADGRNVRSFFARQEDERQGRKPHVYRPPEGDGAA